ncbi:MAG: outer membrane protein assembly factor BamA [SAR116 cluster bacterium]|nr:MAG: outer membrane protein assembly factor BamA [SAR116 cluster bacterium]
MPRPLLILVLLLALVVGTPAPSIAQSDSEQIRIDEIAVSGNRRVAVGTVLSYLPVRVGDRVTRSSLSIALERLYETELFADIQIDIDGETLRIDVVENPIINRVNIEGNDALDDEKLLEIVDIQPRRVYTRRLAVEASQKLLQVYQAAGRYAAVVEPQIIELEDNRVDLAFVVKEGPLIKISSITFNGNERYSDRVLRRAISSRVSSWWAIFATSDKYDEARLDYDVRLLRQFYLARGYADIDVSRVQGGLLPDRTGFAVSFILNEGARYKVNDIAIDSQIENVDLEALRQLFDFGDDGWYDVRALEQGLLDITNELGALGYAFVNIEPEVITDPEAQTLDINVGIGKAQKNFIERIEIVNNVRTLDSVIRREFEVVEGDAFNQLKLERSIRNVRNLGFFSDVSVRNLVGSSEEQTVTELTVEEQSTGEFSIGLGYSSLDQTSFALGLDERNFLGTGRGINFSLDVSASRSNVRIGVSEPYLFGRNLNGRASVFNERIKEDTFSITRRGFDFGIGFAAANDYFHRVGYEISQSETNEKSTKALSVTGENGKTILKSAASYTFGRSTLDNRFDPSDGSLFEVAQEIAGIGGDAKYYRVVLSGAYYKPMMFNTFFLGTKGRIGQVTGLGENVTQSQRFFLGGRRVRGFDGSGIGPRDQGSNAAVGGNKVFNGTFEVVSRAGISKDLSMRWTVFSDFGSVWETDYPSGVTGANDSSIRSSLGAGLLWDTFIGPMSFYWAKPTTKKSYDKTRTFQFTIGTRL